MRFLLDENMRRSARDLLRELGHDAISIVDRAPSINDESVLQIAQEEGRILITNDLDFGKLIFRRGLPTHGVILFRLRIETKEAVHARLREILTNHQNSLVGHFVTVTDFTIRIHKL